MTTSTIKRGQNVNIYDVSKTQVTGQVTGQVNRKNIFLPRKSTIFNSKLTRYEKESVIMRGIVYFKLQDVALSE